MRRNPEKKKNRTHLSPPPHVTEQKEKHTYNTTIKKKK